MIWNLKHSNNDEVRGARRRVKPSIKKKKKKRNWYESVQVDPEAFEKTYKVHLVKLSHPTSLESSRVELTLETQSYVKRRGEWFKTIRNVTCKERAQRIVRRRCVCTFRVHVSAVLKGFFFVCQQHGNTQGEQAWEDTVAPALHRQWRRPARVHRQTDTHTPGGLKFNSPRVQSCSENPRTHGSKK